MWAKYWAFNGMLKIGTYNEQKDTYMKRNNKTTQPFIEINPEIIAKCIGLVQDMVENKKITEENIKELVESGSFKKIYTYYIQKYKNNIVKKNDYDGIWIKYNYKSELDAIKLYNSLQGDNTGWCTAGDKSVAIDQVCDTESYDGGNFYVYYTKNIDNEYKIPRIAIRMNKTTSIGEIRGIYDKSQNLEPGLENIVKEKLDSIENLNVKDKKFYLKAVNDTRYLTKLNEKTKQLTEEDIKFLFEIDEKIARFGWKKDSRIDKIRERNLIKDKKFLLNYLDKNKNILNYATEDLQNDYDIILKLLSIDGSLIYKKYTYLINNKKAVITALTNNIDVFNHISIDLQNDYEVILTAINKDGNILKLMNDESKDDYKVVKVAINNNGCALKDASDRLKNIKELNLITIKSRSYMFKSLNLLFKNDLEIASIAIESDVSNYVYAGPNIKNNKELTSYVLSKNGGLLEYTSELFKNDKDVVEIAVNDAVSSFKYASEKLKSNKNFILKLALKNMKVLKYANQEVVNSIEFQLELKNLLLKPKKEDNPIKCKKLKKIRI